MAKTRRNNKPVTLPPGFNGDIDLQMVDVPDPFEPSKTIRVAKNTKVHPLDFLHNNGRIDDAQFEAGNKFLLIYERAEIGGAQAIDYSRVKVDVSFSHSGLSPDVAVAVTELGEIKCELGRKSYELACRVIGGRVSLSRIAGEVDKNEDPSWKTRGFVNQRIKEVLDELCIYFGSAVGPRSKIRSIYLDTTY